MPHKMDRRDFLKIAGVTLIVAAGVPFRAPVDQGMFSVGQGPAYEAWKNWQDAATPFERIVAAGIPPANPHNSQPWIFSISPSAIDLFADPGRQIGVVDPFRREMYIGLGWRWKTCSWRQKRKGLPRRCSSCPASFWMALMPHIPN